MNARRVLLAVVSVLYLLAGRPAPAESVTESRSLPGSAPNQLAFSANPAYGSAWVISGDSVLHLAANGTKLWDSAPALGRPIQACSVSVNPADGSCWALCNDGSPGRCASTPMAASSGSCGASPQAATRTTPPSTAWRTSCCGTRWPPSCRAHPWGAEMTRARVAPCVWWAHMRRYGRSPAGLTRA